MEKFKAFLYTTNNNEFRVYKGYVYKFDGDEYYSSVFSTTDIGIDLLEKVLSNDENTDIDELKLYIIADTPGTLYNCVIWFEERDDEKAFDIFMKDEIKKVLHHIIQIKIHKDVIESLENEIKEEF